MKQEQVEQLARAAYEDHLGARRDWSKLEPWQRESWRCEVDDSRDPNRIRLIAKSPQKEYEE